MLAGSTVTIWSVLAAVWFTLSMSFELILHLAEPGGIILFVGKMMVYEHRHDLLLARAQPVARTLRATLSSFGSGQNEQLLGAIRGRL